MTKIYKEVDWEGNTFWFKEGTRVLHREDGPAIQYKNEDKFWLKEDKYHREYRPAIEYANGNKYWYYEGRFHREDGPAIELSDGYKEYWYEGISYDVSNLEEFYIKRILE